ncbi:MAG: hybrid sensor histidine kinase/response regulator [Thermodesulfobacteriota bacterium]
MIDHDQTHEFPIGAIEKVSGNRGSPKASNLQCRTLIDAMPDIVLKIDGKGAITFINQGALDVTGYLEDEMLGMNIADVLPPEDLERFQKKRTDLSKAGFQREFYLPESKLINRELGLTPIEIDVISLGTEAAGSEVLLVARDLTARKKLEKERLRRQKYELLSMLSQGFFQEIDATLTEIAEEIQFVSDNLDPSGTAHRRLAGAIKSCDKGRGLVDEMLSVAEPEMAEDEAVSLAEMVTASVASIDFEGRIETILNREEPLWPVLCDPTLLNRALKQLIRNAVEAGSSDSKAEGKIEIRGENIKLEDGEEQTGLFIPAGEYVRISVLDHGHGIPDEYLDRIFDPFFSTRDTGESRTRGLGLTQVYAIIKGHGGYIDVQSKPDIRTVFAVYLPAFRKQIPEKPETSASAGVGRILLMDDEEIVRNVAEQMLRGLGYQVVFAEEGGEAVALYRASFEAGHSFDLVILDLNVKEGMGGRAAMGELLKIDPKVRGIISSGYSSDPEMMDYGRYGFKGVVGKPFHLTDLKRVLKEVLTAYS